MNNEQLKTAKLFDVTALATHLLECDHYLFLNKKSNANPFGGSSATFTLYYVDDIKEALKEMPLPDDTEYAFKVELLREASINEIMTYLLKEDIIKDEEIIRSWNEHFEWHTTLEEQIFPVSIADFVYPESYSDNLYVYSDIFVIQRFADLLINVTDVSFCPEAMGSQNTIINEILPFVIDELIPTLTWGTDEVSEEKITALVQKISVCFAKLFWIYTL